MPVPTDPANVRGARNAPQSGPPPGPQTYQAPYAVQPQYFSWGVPQGGFQIGGARRGGFNDPRLAAQGFNALNHPQPQQMMYAAQQGFGENGEPIPGATSSGTTSPTGQGPLNNWFPGYDNTIDPAPLNQNPGPYGQPTVQLTGGGWGNPNALPIWFPASSNVTGYGTRAPSGTYGPGSGPTSRPTYWGAAGQGLNYGGYTNYGAAGTPNPMAGFFGAGAPGVGFPGPAGSAVMAAHFAHQV